MKTPFTIAIVAALTLTFAQAALADGTTGNGMMSAAASVTVPMKAENGSNEDGTATLTQKGDDVLVTISLKNASSTAQPAHVHTGPCSTLGGVVDPLSNVVDGKSTTTLKNTKLDSLRTGGFAINVHKSAADIATYVSCGDIPKA
jgi:hypothetical protein